MKRALILFASLALCQPAFAQTMEPGEWLLTSTTTSPLLPKPETDSEKKCVTKEEAGDVERWASRDLPADCKLTSDKKSASSLSWQLSCPGSGTRSNGSIRWTRTTFEMDMDMVTTGGAPGQKMEMRTTLSGKRLGPCKK